MIYIVTKYFRFIFMDGTVYWIEYRTMDNCTHNTCWFFNSLSWVGEDLSRHLEMLGIGHNLFVGFVILYEPWAISRLIQSDNPCHIDPDLFRSAQHVPTFQYRVGWKIVNTTSFKMGYILYVKDIAKIQYRSK